MDHYSETPTRDSGFLHEMALGDYSHPGTFLRQAAIRAAVINPAMGAGMFSPASLLMHYGTGFMGAKGQTINRLTAPLLGGYFDFSGPIKARTIGGHVVKTMEDSATRYWAEHSVDATRFINRKGAWSDKFFGWMTGGDVGVFAKNREIMGMIGREASHAGGLLSRAGLRAGLDVAGSGIAGGLRVGMYGLSRALGPIGWGLLAYDLGRAGYAAYKAVTNAAEVAYSRQFQETAVPFVNGYQAQTQRRQALMTIQQSRLNARSAFGFEAKRFHAL
jgi:hypothetical protein